MTDQPWQGDACSLVDAFRTGERSPLEELDATLAAIAASDINAFSFLDPERARTAAADADVSLPFGGVPTGVKELEQVEGWPDTEASLVFRDRIADHTGHSLRRLFEKGGAVPVGLTTASEFGGLNVSVTRLNGVTHNPWQHGRSCGGSSGGSAAAVVGGLVSLATAGDGGGSIRIPCGYTGLLGMKGTFGRITRAPGAYARPNTVVQGNTARSVRDAARFYDVTAGVDPWDPSTIPSPGNWEAGLGTHELRGRKIAIVPAIGGVTLDDGVEEQIREHAEWLAAETGMEIVDLRLDLPNLAAQWAMGNMATLIADLDSRWPSCAKDLTDEIAMGAFLSQAMYNLHTAAVAEKMRIQANEAMAAAFEQVDFIVSATNPGPAFAAESQTSNPNEDISDWFRSSTAGRIGIRGALGTARVAASFAPRLPNRILDEASRRMPDMVAMGALTIISNIYGNPAVSIPAGTIDGLPIGMQVLGRHHEDALLFDVALAVERGRPWPLVAPPVTAASAAAPSPATT